MCLINLDNIRSEKEYYMKEYHRLLEQINGKSGHPNPVSINYLLIIIYF